MQKNVLIDPHMFDLDGKEEIENNIHFFQNIVSLCSSGKIVVYIYTDLYQRILNGEVCPFSADMINVFPDAYTRECLRKINGSFRKALSNNLRPLDIEACEGEQEYQDSDHRLLEDNLYYEMLSILVKPCYEPRFELDKNIVTGTKENGIQPGESVEVSCKCQNQSFKKRYFWIAITNLLTKEDKAFVWLQEANGKKYNYIPEPELVRGNHHNKIQSKPVKNFNSLSIKNKRVLKLLCHFGLSKVIFEEFHQDVSKTPGTIIVKEVQNRQSADIIKGFLYTENGYRHNVSLYFPVGVAQQLSDFLRKDFSLKRTEELIDKLGLQIIC